MKLREIMNPNPITVEIGAELSLARSKMIWANVREVPVLDEQRVVGILTEHDVLAFLTATPDIGKSIPVVDMAMTKPVKTAAPDDSLTEAAARMAAGGIGCLPVTDQGHLVGMVTAADVLRAEAEAALMPHTSPLAAHDVMAPISLTLAPQDKMLEAVARMQRAGVIVAPVVDGDGAVLGVLTENEVRAVMRNPRASLEAERSDSMAKVSVADVMSAGGVTARSDASVSEVVGLCIEHRAIGLPVVDDADRLVGVISYLDLLRAAF